MLLLLHVYYSVLENGMALCRTRKCSKLRFGLVADRVSINRLTAFCLVSADSVQQGAAAHHFADLSTTPWQTFSCCSSSQCQARGNNHRTNETFKIKPMLINNSMSEKWLSSVMYMDESRVNKQMTNCLRVKSFYLNKVDCDFMIPKSL